LRQGLAADPDHVPSLSLLAQIAGRAGRDKACVELLERVLEVGTEAQAAAAGLWLGAAHRRAGRMAQARAALRTASTIAEDAGLLNSLGVALKDIDDLESAAISFEQAVLRRPGFVEALYNLATARKDQGRTDEAVTGLQQVLELAPDLAAARFALCMAHLPAIYRSEAEIEAKRSAYAEQLDALAAYAKQAGPESLAGGVGAAQPFYLAYQGRNDLDLQRRYGRIVCDAMAARYPNPQPTVAPGQDEKIRVGFVSGFFRRHANWNLPLEGWLKGLDRSRFEVFGYHTAGLVDDRTAEAKAVCQRFVQGPLSTDQWRNEILADRPHVLI
jgi:protein O-GlcNAc transferase